MKSHLQVKVFSMAAEMTYIRHQEEKWKNRARNARAKQKAQATADTSLMSAATAQEYAETNFWSLRWHREQLKYDARWSHLAYGFMKGRSYSQMEYLCYGDVKGRKTTPPNWARIEEIVTKFSSDESDVQGIMQRFGSWLADAKIWYDGNPGRIEQAVIEREKAYKERLADPAYQAYRAENAKVAERAGRRWASAGWTKDRNGRWKAQASA